MHEIPVEKLEKAGVRLPDDLGSGRLLLTRKGKPFAVVLGVETHNAIYDAEDWDHMTDPEFWKMIEDRRREPTIPWDEAKARLLGDNGRATRASGAKSTSSTRNSKPGRAKVHAVRKGK